MAEREAREAIERAEQEKELRRMKEQNLAPEPAANEPNISKISIRLSDGTRLERRFLRSDTVQVRRPSFFLLLTFFCFSQTLYDYVDTKEKNYKAYNLRTNYPRLVLEDMSATLESMKLYPAAAVIVEEKE